MAGPVTTTERKNIGGNTDMRGHWGTSGVGDNIKIDLNVIVCMGMDWVHLAQSKDH
jgi:hypothetical protein